MMQLHQSTSTYFSDLFTREAMREIFSDTGLIRAWLRVEAALAAAEAECGIVPTTAAEGIAKAACLENLDLAAMKAEYERVGFPISPLVHQLAKVCDEESARWVHWGATTQDIIDTGFVLQIRDGLGLVESDIEAVLEHIARLAEEHRSTVMAGRTFQQQAAPITFGYKAAVWLDEMLRHRDRLSGIKARVLVCQLGGGVGTLATLGRDGLAVRRAFASVLQLREPDVSWHTARDGWAELVHWLAMVGATLAKIATEVAALMRTEVAEVPEVSEPRGPGRGGSSTMPQKRNPTAAPPVIAVAHRLRECVGSELTAMIQEHERGVAAQPLERLIVPEAFCLLSGALKHSRDTLAGLVVDKDRMRLNLDSGGGFLMAEAVMMGLAPIIGRQEAHKLVAAASNRAIAAGQTLREGLLAEVEIMNHLTTEDLDRLLDPASYLGCAGEMIDRVLAKAGREPPMHTDEEA